MSKQTPPVVLLVGNPNVGKTTVFNRLSGQNARVGNYAGVTVERRTATLRLENGPELELVDVPGCYSLSARSPEEQIALSALLGIAGNPRPALVVVVVDCGQLARNLYLVLQLAELGLPLLIVLNMLDEAGHDAPRPDAVGALFGVPAVATDARRGRGIDELRQAIGAALAAPRSGRIHVRYPEALRRDVDRVADTLPAAWRGSVERDRALALWALSSVDEHDELENLGPALRARCLEVQHDAGARDLESEIVATRWALIDARAPELTEAPRAHPPKRRSAERIDRVLLHPLLGFVCFLGVMLVVFQSLFAWSDPAIRGIEALAKLSQSALRAHAPDGVLRDLLTEGVIGGVGNVVVFLPQIVLLFLFIGLLEDSGYMARVAYLMDRVMRSLGLHGRAFVPMLSGFACAVPAILATRTMERQRDRLLTMLVVPLMTCSARLPVYTLVIGALFPPRSWFGVPVQGLLMVLMYVFSTLVTLIAAAVLGRTVVKGRRVPLLLELPPYRWPEPRGLIRRVVESARSFLTEAGTMILACTIVLWALLSFPRAPTHPAEPAPISASAVSSQSAAIAHSYGGRLGRALEPALAPLGFDWKIGVGILGAFAAREVFISTLGLVYGIGEVDADAAPLRAKLQRESRPDGSPSYRPLTGLSLMVFFALACQCMSTLAVVRRETRSWRWPAFLFGYMTALAWLASFAVYQIGSALGF